MSFDSFLLTLHLSAKHGALSPSPSPSPHGDVPPSSCSTMATFNHDAASRKLNLMQTLHRRVNGLCLDTTRPFMSSFSRSHTDWPSVTSLHTKVTATGAMLGLRVLLKGAWAGCHGVGSNRQPSGWRTSVLSTHRQSPPQRSRPHTLNTSFISQFGLLLFN